MCIRDSWSAASFIETTVAELKAQLGNDKVVLGLSGGVDSVSYTHLDVYKRQSTYSAVIAASPAL